MEQNQDPNQRNWELPPRKEKYTYSDILPLGALGINYDDLRFYMQDRKTERDLTGTIYEWVLSSRFHNVTAHNLDKGRNQVNKPNLVGLYGELKAMIITAGMIPEPMIGVQVDENNQIVFPTFRGRNEVQYGMHGGSVILTDPRMDPSDVKKKEIDFLMGCDTFEYGIVPIVGQVKLKLSAPQVERDISINRMSFFTKVLNRYKGFVPIFCTLEGEYRDEVAQLIAAYQHVGGTHVPMQIDYKAFNSFVNQYRKDYGLMIID